MTQQQIHIVDDLIATDPQTDPTQASDPDLEAGDLDVVVDVQERGRSQYEDAKPIDLRTAYGRRRARFVRAVAGELEKDELLDDVREVDRLDLAETDDVDLGALLVLPDESLLFLGSDPTARDAVPLFAFAVGPFEPIPAPTTAREALDLLRPGAVREAFEADEDSPARQGEWWLLETRQVPVGEPFRPGVRTRPFGPSPLGNHVPREWGMTVQAREFVSSVRERVDELPASIETEPEVLEWVHRQHNKTPTPAYAPDYELLQEAAGTILVRGTLRHREDDHFVEDLGDDWHVAITHDMDVYTGDDYLERVRID